VPACDHCALEIGPGTAIRGQSGGRETVFCCTGCRSVYFLLVDERLDGFYSRRTGWTPGPPPFAPLDPAPFADAARDIGDAREIDLTISGIRCASCVWLIEKHLGKKPGILFARVNYATHRATVRWDPELTDAETVARRIAELGYIPSPRETTGTEEVLAREKTDLLLRLGAAAFLSSQIMMVSAGLYAGYFQGIERQTRTLFHLVAMGLATPVLLYSGYPFLRNAVAGIRNRTPGMDTLVFLGAFSAYAYSVAMVLLGGEVYFDTTAMIITLVLVGRYLEAAARGRAADTIARLFRLAPVQARRVRSTGDGSPPIVETVPVSLIQTGDVVEVIPGERIPADGLVSEGESETDESLLTGEARPVDKGPGSQVFTGTLNGSGRLRFKVTGTGRETALSRIIRAVEEAQARRSPVQGLADRAVGYFVPAIILVSLIALGIRLLAGHPVGTSLLASVSVLVVACPCALGLATPLAVFVGTSAAQSAGILVKGGDVLEKGAKVTAVFFDKTGTLTKGSPHVTNVIGFTLPRDELVAIAASLESPSEHVLAKAIRRECPDGEFRDVSRFRAHPGLGVEGIVDGRRFLLGKKAFLQSRGAAMSDKQQDVARSLSQEGKTVVWLSDEERAVGLLAAADALRPESAGCVRKLAEAGYDLAMVTGDGEAVSAEIAGKAGIGRVLSSLTPSGKTEEVRKARANGAVVLMVGDGINDAPALTEADVGLAMGRGTDIALESADAVLVRENLQLVPQFLAIAQRTMRIIRQNLAWAFSYNAVAIPLAVSGMLHPVMSAALMAGSSLMVVGNSLRLRKEAA